MLLPEGDIEGANIRLNNIDGYEWENGCRWTEHISCGKIEDVELGYVFGLVGGGCCCGLE